MPYTLGVMRQGDSEVYGWMEGEWICGQMRGIWAAY